MSWPSETLSSPIIKKGKTRYRCQESEGRLKKETKTEKEKKKKSESIVNI